MLSEKEISFILNRKLLNIKYLNRLFSYLKDKKILITGAGGSIGSELLKNIINYKPAIIIALDNNELSLFNLKKKLFKHKNIIYILGDINMKYILKNIFIIYHPNIVIHSAAYKHIYFVEHNSYVGYINNFLATKILIDLSLYYQVEKFIFISTDKAVYPKSIMGITKRLCELYIISYYEYYNIKNIFMIIRLGNIFLSNGSVVKIFLDQIKKNKPLTVTHSKVKRFFSTIKEVGFLILKILINHNSSLLYVISIGKCIKILHLASRIIKLFYKKNYNYPFIRITKLKKYEKIQEKFMYNNEYVISVIDNNIFNIINPMFNYKQTLYNLNLLLNHLLYNSCSMDHVNKLSNLIIYKKSYL